MRTFMASMLLLSACASRAPASGAPASGAGGDRAAAFAPEEEARFVEWLTELEHVWLDRDTVPAPVVSYAPQSMQDGGLVLTVAPALPEGEPWNAWPDGTARLFNDGVGYLWRVQLQSERPVRWSPAHTQLAVNDTEQTFQPVIQPDDLLLHLVQGAVLETQTGGPPNLALRMRNADDFRRAYLGTDTRAGAREGVLVFPAPSRVLQAVAMELTLGVIVEGEGLKQYRFLFE